MRTLFAAIFACSASIAAAQDIGIKMEQIPAGSWYTLKSAGNGHFTHVFLGKKGRYYAYGLVDGKDPNGSVGITELRDGKGQIVQRTLPGGRKITYTPHNCARTIGQCAFTEAAKAHGTSKAYSTKMVRVNTPKGNGFTFTQVAVADDGTQHPIRSGEVKSLDSMGMLEKATMVRHSDNKKLRFRKLSASWD